VSESVAYNQTYVFNRILNKTNYFLTKPSDINKIDLNFYNNYKVFAFTLESSDKLYDSSVKTIKRRKTIENIFIDENFKAIEKEIESQASIFNTARPDSPMKNFNMNSIFENKKSMEISIPNAKSPQTNGKLDVAKKPIPVVDFEISTLKRPSFKKNLELLSHLSDDESEIPKIAITADMTKKEKLMAKIANAKRVSIPNSEILMMQPKTKLKTLVKETSLSENYTLKRDKDKNRLKAEQTTGTKKDTSKTANKKKK